MWSLKLTRRLLTAPPVHPLPSLSSTSSQPLTGGASGLGADGGPPLSAANTTGKEDTHVPAHASASGVNERAGVRKQKQEMRRKRKRVGATKRRTDPPEEDHKGGVSFYLLLLRLTFSRAGAEFFTHPRQKAEKEEEPEEPGGCGRGGGIRKSL